MNAYTYTEENYESRRISNFLDWAHKIICKEIEQIDQMEAECGDASWFDENKKPGRVAKTVDQKIEICQRVDSLRDSGSTMKSALKTVGISDTAYHKYRNSAGLGKYLIKGAKGTKPKIRRTTKPRDMGALARDAYDLILSGMTCENAAKELKSSRKTIRKAMRMNGINELPSKRQRFDVKDILALSKEGMTTSDIGKKFNCSRQAISERMLKAGYKYDKKTKKYSKN